MRNSLSIFTGNANRKFAEEVCEYLDVPLSDALVGRFSEGEIRVKINENVRGKDVFLIQPTCPPVNENLVELLIMTDALRRASAERITAVLPYYGYARQDRKDQPRVPITAKLVANIINGAGASRVLTMDLHAGQIQGFFDIPLDNLYAITTFCDYIKKMHFKDLVVVAPDVGGIKMARDFANRLGSGLGIVDKRRVSPVSTEVMNILGEIEGKEVVLVDDIIATGGSLTEAANALKKNGAKEIYAAISHGILSGDAIEKLEKSEIKELIITNTIPLSEEKKHPKVKALSVAPLFGEAIKRIHKGESVSCLFD